MSNAIDRKGNGTMTQVTNRLAAKRQQVTILGKNVGTCRKIIHIGSLLRLKDFIPSNDKGRFFPSCDWLNINYTTGWIDGEEVMEYEEEKTREIVFAISILDLLHKLTPSRQETA